MSSSNRNTSNFYTIVALLAIVTSSTLSQAITCKSGEFKFYKNPSDLTDNTLTCKKCECASAKSNQCVDLKGCTSCGSKDYFTVYTNIIKEKRGYKVCVQKSNNCKETVDGVGCTKCNNGAPEKHDSSKLSSYSWCEPTSNVMPIVLAAVGGLVVIGLIVFFVMKKKKNGGEGKQEKLISGN
jgi:hypothetical protein